MSKKSTQLPQSSLPSLRSIELIADHEPLVQRFLEANPEYSLLVHGEPPTVNEAHEAIYGELPAGWSFTKKWLIGYVDADGALVAMANVVSDLLAPDVWHLGLFIVATSRHGIGDARALYCGLEDWAAANGARWHVEHRKVLRAGLPLDVIQCSWPHARTSCHLVAFIGDWCDDTT